MRVVGIPSWAVALLPLLAVAFAEPDPAALRRRDYDLKDYYALHIKRGFAPAEVAQRFGLSYEHPLGQLEDHYVFSGPKGSEDVVSEHLELHRRRKAKRHEPGALLERMDPYDSVLFAEKQRLKKLVKRAAVYDPSICEGRARKRDEIGVQPVSPLEIQAQSIAKTLGIGDPTFLEQWHLFNSVEKGHDVNVTGLWLEGITGANSTVAIVDDGIDMHSDDLRDNYFAAGSWDFNDQNDEPKPRLSDDRHGTRCAGEIGAVKNDVCGVGVAYDGQVAGIRILSKSISDADEADALNYAFHDNQIYSCSWGPPDDGQAMDAPGILIKKSILNGVQKGRNGKGSIFVFASGNGAGSGDNCNFDGYTNSIYSITVGAIDRKGMHPYYSESCSANMVITYSSGSNDAIHTTDVGKSKCNASHGGTSAAAPLAAGIFALVLSIRPDLTWRDMQYLAMRTAVPVNEDDPDWDTTHIGYKYNHMYGYGKLDAYAIVKAAETYEKVKPQAWYHSPIIHVNHEIPEGQKGLRSEFKITQEMLDEANIARLEHVTVTMNVEHGKRGDLSVDLYSPYGIVSHIATERKLDKSTAGYKDWTFMSVKHWGEEGVGAWSVVTRDTQENQFNGSWVDWSITLWGEAKDEDKAYMHPLPGEDDHGRPTTTAGNVHTTDLPSHTGGAVPTANPTDHPDRPINAKPTGAASQNGTASEDTEAEADNAGFLPSFLPTFGVSAKTQAWIYGSFVVIAGFIAVVAVYLVRQRRKQKANKDPMGYEFAALDSEDLEEGFGDDGAGAGVAGAGKPRRKARDLYDAFGASDEEGGGDFFSDDDDDEKRGTDYESEDDEQARGIDEGRRTGDREKLLKRGE